MTRTVTVVGGAGTVGATAAYTLAVSTPGIEVRLCDVEHEAAAGHATDLRHARCYAAHALGPDGPTADVHYPILGEHGEHLVPAFSRATVDSDPLELPPEPGGNSSTTPGRSPTR